jgi:hypothetical protein
MRASRALCLLIFLCSVSLQWFLHREALNDSLENRSSLSSTDTRDYARRAGLLRHEGFTAAFADGHRTPGYPVFLAAFLVSSETPWRAARFVQIVLSAAVILFAFLAFVNLLGSHRRALAAAAAVALWAPLYYFSPVLIAEAPSLFVFSVLLWVLSRAPEAGSRFARWATLPLLFALLVYLKPNHFLLILPVAAFLALRPRGGKAPASAFVLLSLALLTPWGLFVSAQHGKPVFLSTAAGVNLYLGTGAAALAGEEGTLPHRVAPYIGFAAGERRPLDLSELASARAEDSVLGRRAGEIWRAHPARTALYATAKALHGFGFSFRGPRDALLALFFAASVFFAARLWRRGMHREWVILFTGILIVTFFQMFLYLPNQRFKTVLFDLPALMILSLGLLEHRRGDGSKKASPRTERL